MAIRRLAAFLALGVMAGGAPAAHADVTAKAPDGFVIQIKTVIAKDRDDAWARLLDVGSWWSSAHTYSGDARMMSIDARAGGCWCELWGGGEVEHGRLLMVMPREAIRLEAPLGPLQEMGVKATLTWSLESAPNDSTLVTLDFRVVGSSLSGLEAIAQPVDGVLAEAMARYASPK
jgi:hypothetical protein